MAKQTLRINSIFDGKQTSSHFGQPGQFLDSIAIDPDAPVTDGASDFKPSGAIRPVGYAEFSGATLDQVPFWLETSPKTSLLYAYGASGDLYTYSSVLGSETLLRAVASSSGNGLEYYNNYLYYARNTDIGRYGPLDGAAAASDTFWSSTLGLTALSNTTYPTSRHSLQYRNHPMKVHVDNKLYIGDVVNGRGVVHFIRTTKVTSEGDTNDGSAYEALDLPFNFLPMDIESYGQNLAIACSLGTSAVVRQGRSYLVIWDTTSPSFSRVVPVDDPIISALKYQNGVLYVFSGNLVGGTRVSIYLGGDSLQTIAYIPDSLPPFAGAVEAEGNRIMWGGFTIYPTASASVFAFGSKSDLFPRGLHNIARSTVTATSSNGIVTALKNVLQNAKMHPNLVIGGYDGTNINLDSRSTTYQTSVWRSQVFDIGRPFSIERVRLPLGTAVAANMTIVPKLFFDDEQASQAGTTINATNYPASQKNIILGNADFTNGVHGQYSFFLELTFSGTALLPVNFPIEIDVDVHDVT